jgi:hypothetical protein
MYRETMALRGNPFGPKIELTPENRQRIAFLTNLHRSPLRLDQSEQLRSLFCDRILGLEGHMDRFRRLMRKLDYVFEGDPSRSAESALIVIRGAQGAGKTTLGSWMIAEIARLPGEQPHVMNPPEPIDETPSAFRTTLEQMTVGIENVPRGQHLAALIRNVTQETLNAAIARFNELPHWPRLFVLTTSNLKLLSADPRTIGGKAEIAVFDLRNVEPADAEAYVAHRLPQFRDPDRPEIREVSEVFPFSPGLAGRFVQSRTEGAAPVVLRQLNAHFRAVLTDHATALWERQVRPPPVAEASPDALAGYLLSEDDLFREGG